MLDKAAFSIAAKAADKPLYAAEEPTMMQEPNNKPADDMEDESKSKTSTPAGSDVEAEKAEEDAEVEAQESQAEPSPAAKTKAKKAPAGVHTAKKAKDDAPKKAKGEPKAKTAQKPKVKKTKDPDAKPKTAYQAYMKAVIPKLKASRPDQTSKDLFSEAAAAWSSLEADAKAAYKLQCA